MPEERRGVGGLSELMQLCPTQREATRYLDSIRWGGEPVCTRCGADNRITPQKKPVGRYWCSRCRKYFTACTGTPLEYAKVDARKWVFAAHRLMTARKGISALQLSRELSVSQDTAWRMLYRLRSACNGHAEAASGVAEGDVAYAANNRSVILEGDFLEVIKSVSPRKFDVIIADPPYNIGKDFGNDSDKQPLAEYIEWTREWVDVCLKHLKEQGVLYIYGFPEIIARIAVHYPLDQQRWLVWHYTNKAVPGLKFWQRSHETILALWRGRRPNLQIDQIREEYTEHFKRCIGRPWRDTRCRYNRDGNGDTIYNGHANGALPRDVLKVPALAGGAGRSERWFVCRDCDERIYPPNELPEHADHDILKHPTQKPMELTRRLLRSCIEGSEGSVLIPFAGSGSECVVSRTLGIDFVGCEINPEFVRFARKWIAYVTGEPCTD